MEYKLKRENSITFQTQNRKQADAAKFWADDTTEEIVYGGAKGGGKSFLGAALILADALTYPDTHYFIARKELTDLRKYTIPTIHEVLKHFNISADSCMSYNGQDNVFTLNNGSKIYLISCDERPGDPLFERFGSMQMTRGWIEEGGEVAESAKANLWLAIGRWKNDTYKLKKKLLITCNPKKNWIKRDYVDPFKSETLASTKKFVSALATDNPYLQRDYIETLRNERDETRRQRLWAGNWDYADDVGALFTHEDITDMWGLEIEDKSGKYMTVDVARHGDDKTVFCFWKGYQLYRVETFIKQGTDITSLKLKEFSRAEGIAYSRIVVDEDGIGGAVVDNCRGVHGFINNSSPLPNENPRYEYLEKPNFANLKTQCAHVMAEKVKSHQVSIAIKGNQDFADSLTEELQTYKIKHPDNDLLKIGLVSKDDQKLTLGRSPDYGDAFIMRGLFSLKRSFRSISPEQEAFNRAQEAANHRDFDPFSIL